MKNHRFIVMFVISCVFLASAADYADVVVDSKTNNPLPGVLVSVGYSEAYTRTDANGR